MLTSPLAWYSSWDVYGITTRIGICLWTHNRHPIPSVGNSHTSAGPRLTTLEEDRELFVEFSLILCLWFEIQGMRIYNLFDRVSNTAHTSPSPLKSHWALNLGTCQARDGTTGRIYGTVKPIKYACVEYCLVLFWLQYSTVNFQYTKIRKPKVKYGLSFEVSRSSRVFWWVQMTRLH